MKTLGCSIALRNGNVFDYPWKECIQSVLPFVQEVVVAESDSTDDTLQDLQALAEREPKVKIWHYPWPNPKGDGRCVMTWTNFARERLSTDYNLQMDIDEILPPEHGPKIVDRIQGSPVTLCIRRLNFYRDAQHLIPDNNCCGHAVLRVSPKTHWLPADTPDPQGQDAMNLHTDAMDIEIFHYNWLRKREAFFLKERGIQTAFFNDNDPKLVTQEAIPGNWMAPGGNWDWENRLVKFNGQHPAIMHQWLKDRGWMP